MAHRLLFARRYHLWGAVVLLAAVSSVATAAPRYVKTYNPAEYKKHSGQWYRTSNGTYDWADYNQLERALIESTAIDVGTKVLNLPAKAPIAPAATIGKRIAQISRFTTPLALGSILLEYMLQNGTNYGKDLQDCGGSWSIGCEQTGIIPDDQPYLWQPYDLQGYAKGPKKNSPMTACNALGGNELGGTGNPTYSCGTRYSTGGYAARGSITRVTNTCLSQGLVWDNATSSCVEEQPLAYIPNPPTEQDWDEIEQTPTWDEPTAPVIEELGRTEPGVPMDTPPQVDGVPMKVPLSDPYQNPTSGGWEQPIATITPGSLQDGTVGAETGIEPVTGPEGIPDPSRPIVPVEPPASETPGTTEIDVELCEPGDTNLACVDLGTPEEATLDKDTFELTFEHSPVVFSESAACPAGPDASTPWGTVTFDMYWPCEFATAIKPIILALGAFAAIAIFVGGLRTS